MSNRSKLLKVRMQISWTNLQVSASSQTEEKEYRSSQRLVWILVIVIRMIRLNALLSKSIVSRNLICINLV